MWSALALTVLALAGLAFWAGYRAADGAAPDRERHRELMTELQRAYGDNARFRERIAALERSEQVARNANDALREQIGELQDEVADATNDLTLYKGLASAAGSAQDGLGIHQLVVRPTRVAGVYAYTVTLIQNLEHAEPVYGRLWLQIEGSRAGEPRRLGLGETGASEEDSREFSFKYFRLLDGTLALPSGFEPARVLVRARAEGSGDGETVEADFDWSTVVQKAPRHTTESGAPGS